MPRVEHSPVVVALNHQEVGLADVELGALGDFPHVGGHHEIMPPSLDKEAHIVGGVMGSVEGGDSHSRHFERNLLEDVHVVVLDAAGDIVVAQHPFEQLRSAIDAHVLVGAHDFVGVAHMVGVVVSENNSAYHIRRNTVARQHLEHRLGVDAGIDEHATLGIAQKCAVAAAAASQTYEMHRCIVVSHNSNHL